MTAPEDANNPTLLKQTIEGARTHLVALTTYLASLAALVGGHHVLTKKLEYSNLEALLFASIPLVLSLLFLTLPAWLKRRREAKLRYFGIHGKLEDPGYFLLRPYEARDRDRFRRPDGADADVLDWIRTTQEPLLYLTGRSGAGKSSLLGASVLPQLQKGTDPAFHAISVRSYRDPSDELRQTLREPGAIWQSPPDDGLRRLLEKAAAHLGPKRLLVVVDQFEELLILHDDGEQHEFVELLRSLHDDPIPGLCVLLSARSDYLGPIGDLELGSLELRKTWMEISPFTEMAARAFLENSGLRLDEKRLDDLIQEAAEIEETRGQIRPITLNLLGVVMDRQGSRPLKSGRVLRGYLAEAIEDNELSDCARQILESLITDVGTKEPRSVEEIAADGALNNSMVRGGLLRLGNLGLVRQIDPDRGVWEISHDFLARLLGSIIGRWKASWRHVLRPSIAPLGLIIWSIVLLSLSHISISNRQAKIVKSLNDIGFHIEQNDIGNSARFVGSPEALDLELATNLLSSLEGDTVFLSIAGSPVGDIELLSRLPELLHLDLSYTQVTNISTLDQLRNLQSLGLNQTPVSDLTPLSRLFKLQDLGLSGTSILSIEPLGRLPKLTHLDLFNARTADISPLSHISGLQYLDLTQTNVENIESLSRHLELRHLELMGTRVHNLAPLAQLKQLQHLNIAQTDIRDLKPLSKLKNLQHLSLKHTSIINIEGISQLTNLQHLDLSSTQVSDIEPISQLFAIQHLDLAGTETSDLSPLSQLTELRYLNLGGTQTDNLQPLSQLLNLHTLKLGATYTNSIMPLARLSNLRSLNLLATDISEISTLGKLVKIQELDLSHTQIRKIESLRHLTALQSLSLSHTEVDHIEALKYLTNLESLDISHTPITDPSPLRQLMELQDVNFSGTKLDNLAVLHELESRGLLVYYP